MIVKMLIDQLRSAGEGDIGDGGEELGSTSSRELDARASRALSAMADMTAD
jgi:hypothetical protein